MFFNKKKIAPQEEETIVMDAKTIHKDFYSSSEKAVEEAKAILAESESAPTKKAERLTALGFYNSEEVIKYNDLRYKARQAQLVLDYIVRYPNYKFINETQVKSLCRKYRLVLAEVGRYKGEIPEKNLREIEEFKMAEQDQAISAYGYPGHSSYSGILDVTWRYTPHKMICAPQKDFVQNGTKVVDGYKLVPKDPIVLQPIAGGYLILTAWGEEAQDENVINPIKN